MQTEANSISTQFSEEISDSKILDFLENQNDFEYLDSNDKGKFKEILSNHMITLEEMDSLNYSQAKKLKELIFPEEMTKNDKKVPLFKSKNPDRIMCMFYSMCQSNDDDFNHALYKTAREMSNKAVRNDLFTQVELNISQAYHSQPIRASYNAAIFAETLWKEDLLKMNINFSEFLKDAINTYETIMQNRFTHPSLKEQYSNLIEGYKLIQSHYENIKNQ